MRPTLLFHLYTLATMVLVPFFARAEVKKLRRAGVTVDRAHEKLGHASQPRRGHGKLVWCHAASVGESLAALSVIAAMGRLMPEVQFLITSGTATSAELIAKRLPARTLHQFAPLDAPGPVKRFLDHWRPDAAIFVESELWPQMLTATRNRGVPMALVNARLSASSRAAWKKRPLTARFVLGCFDLILTQNDEMAEEMVAMNAPADRVARGTNLKALSDPLPQDPAVLAQVRTHLKGRVVWVASSTHPGEEEIILQAHKVLLATHPDLCLILAPRHPDRSSEVEALCHAAGCSVAIRSKGAWPEGEAVYLADTLGELGNWYALSKVVFLGGSLFEIGGHNPFEVAQAGAAVLSGPHVTNFAETFDAMRSTGAARDANDAAELAATVDLFLTDDFALEEACRAARDYVRGTASDIDAIAARLIRALSLEDQRS